MIDAYGLGMAVVACCALLALFTWALYGDTVTDIWRRIAILLAGIFFWPVVLVLFVIWGVCAGLKDWKNSL